MAEKRVERVSKYNLSGASEDTYASQTAQNPTTARRAKSVFPSPAGYLEREQPNASFASNVLPSGVVWLFEFDQNNAGNTLRFYFCATSTTLYLLTGAPGVGTWNAVSAVGALANTPQAVSINNLMHFTDGVSSFIFDGTNWITDGLPIPLHAPQFGVQVPGPSGTIVSITRTNGVVTVVLSAPTGITNAGAFVTISGTADATFNSSFQVATGAGGTTFTFLQPGFPDHTLGAGGTAAETSFSVQSNRFYWTTWEDQSTTHPHESTSSPQSLGTGAFSNSVVQVQIRSGTAQLINGSNLVVGAGTDFDQHDVGLLLRASGSPANVAGYLIASVQDAQHLMLATPALATSGGVFVIAPVRATHWNIYCSETENSNVGFLLAQIQIANGAVLGPNFGTGVYFDQSPFINVITSYISQTQQRPLRNDPTTGSTIMTVHKRRIFRRNEQLRNFFNYTAYEEVKAGGVGTAEESVPGHDPNTLSDIVNEQSYPDESRRITGMISHADALFIGTEKNATPMFGESLDDFVLSQIVAFSVGFGSQYALTSAPHGLIFLSYDRKMYLWPQQWIPFYAPEETTALIELSRPKRIDFQNINPAAMAATWSTFFNYGKRNWLIVAFQDNTLAWHTWVFDFETKGWFEMQRGVSSLAVFEVSPGVRALIGGGVDGNVYVLDDPSGFFSTTGIPLPAATFRPSLIDFGQPDTKHLLLYVEFEVDSAALANDITVNYYLDPINADKPGVPTKITMQKVRGANRYRGFFVGGSVCERVLVEFLVAASQNSGVVRSITLAAKSVSKLIL